MNGNKHILLDSNILIYLSQKKLSIEEVFDKKSNYFISLVTYMEILSYSFSSKDEEQFVRKLLSFFDIIDIDRDIAEEVIRLKKSRKIKLPDAIIVATALTHNATLYTNDKQLHTINDLNIRHFTL